ncbi:cytochrome P450 [Thermobifida alba]|uniref:Cytochrome P450 n=1 Tax=Thermobifida alba TaxID=53522 RepID=A0ABY4LAF1_THEAE|nr:cytochrome P450 [Thermobifida alba]UPT23223.1 cytochrome P450 [Thermobifida alba]
MVTSRRTVPPAPHQAFPVLPGPPVLGWARHLRRDLLGVLTRVSRDSPGLAGFKVAGQTFAVADSPDAIRDVLIEKADDFDKGRRQVNALGPVMGKGLLISQGELHTRQRRLILPHFTPRNVRRHADHIVAEAEHLIDTWGDRAEVDLLDEMNSLTMNIVTRLLFSSRIEDDRAIADAITTVFEWEMYALTSLFPIPMRVPTPRNLRARAEIAYVRQRLGAFVEERRRNPGAYSDLLTLLMEARYEDGTTMSEEQLLDEVITVWGASQETSADAQAWTLYLLAQHPEVLARVRAEIDTVLGDRPATFADLASLPYSLRVFKEAMRLYPPGAVLMRTAVRDTTVAGFHVPRGTQVFISTYTLHRREELYPDPERFDPDRFTKERERVLPKQSYLPFGAGHHVCVGSHLALMEGHLLTVTLAQRVDVELCSDRPVEPLLLINLRPRGGIPARVTRR